MMSMPTIFAADIKPVGPSSIAYKDEDSLIVKVKHLKDNLVVLGLQYGYKVLDIGSSSIIEAFDYSEKVEDIERQVDFDLIKEKGILIGVTASTYCFTVNMESRGIIMKEHRLPTNCIKVAVIRGSRDPCVALVSNSYEIRLHGIDSNGVILPAFQKVAQSFPGFYFSQNHFNILIELQNDSANSLNLLEGVETCLVYGSVRKDALVVNFLRFREIQSEENKETSVKFDKQSTSNFSQIQTTYVAVALVSSVEIISSLTGEHVRKINSEHPVWFMLSVLPRGLHADLGMVGDACIAFYYQQFYSFGFSIA